MVGSALRGLVCDCIGHTVTAVDSLKFRDLLPCLEWERTTVSPLYPRLPSVHVASQVTTEARLVLLPFPLNNVT